MDEGMDTSVDTSDVGTTDVDTSSDMGYTDDVLSDIPENVSEDIPEDNFSDSEEISDDIPGDIEENDVEAAEDYSDDIPEDNLNEDISENDSSDIEAEIYDTQDELPEDTEETGEPLEDSSDEYLANDLPEDTSNEESDDMDLSSETPNEIPEDVSDEETVQETEEILADTDTEAQPTYAQEEVGDETIADESAETPVDADQNQSADAPRSQARETGDYETEPETLDGNNFETVGEFAPASNPYASDEWDKLKDVPFAGDVQENVGDEAPADEAAETSVDTGEEQSADTQPEVTDETSSDETEEAPADTDAEEQPTDVQEDVGDEAPADEAAETPVNTEEEQSADTQPEATDETPSDETEEAPADTVTEEQPTDVQEDASNEAPINEAAEMPTDTDEEQSADALRFQEREPGDYETKPETLDGNNFETVGEFAPASNPYASEEWDKLKDVPFAGDETQTKPQDDINTEIQENSIVDTTSITDAYETAPVNSVADYMSAHNYGHEDFDTYSQDPEWRDLMRKEYPDYELPPLNELQNNDDIAKQLENSSAVSKADLRDFDPEFSKEFSDAIADAKKDFPDLKMNYCGTIQNQVEGIRQTIADDYEKSLRAINGDKFTDDFYKQVADDYANDMVGQFGLNDSDDTFAWSLKMPEGPYEKYNGIAINEKYASDNDLFNQAKQYEVETKHKPVGCNTSRATVDHELGHEIDNLVNASEDDYMNNLYEEFLGENNPTDTLSGYSQTSIKEFIAEGYSEYRNNPNPRDYSTKIYNRLVHLYGKRGNE